MLKNKCLWVKTPNKAIKQENLQLAVFTAFNILASYKFPLIEALVVQGEFGENTHEYMHG